MYLLTLKVRRANFKIFNKIHFNRKISEVILLYTIIYWTMGLLATRAEAGVGEGASEAAEQHKNRVCRVRFFGSSFHFPFLISGYRIASRCRSDKAMDGQTTGERTRTDQTLVVESSSINISARRKRKPKQHTTTQRSVDILPPSTRRTPPHASPHCLLLLPYLDRVTPQHRRVFGDMFPRCQCRCGPFGIPEPQTER